MKPSSGALPAIRSKGKTWSVWRRLKSASVYPKSRRQIGLVSLPGVRGIAVFINSARLQRRKGGKTVCLLFGLKDNNVVYPFPGLSPVLTWQQGPHVGVSGFGKWVWKFTKDLHCANIKELEIIHRWQALTHKRFRAIFIAVLANQIGSTCDAIQTICRFGLVFIER